MMDLLKLFDRRIFYHHIKDTVENHDRPLHRAWHCFEMLAFAVYAVRFVFIALSMMDLAVYPMAEFDFFEYEFLFLSTDRDYLYICTYFMLMVNSFFLERYLYFTRVDTWTWQILYEQVCREGDTFEKCLFSEDLRKELLKGKCRRLRLGFGHMSKVPPVLLELWCMLQAKASIFLKQEYIDRDKLHRHELKLFHRLSTEHRLKMYTFLQLLEGLNFGIIAISNIAIIVLSAYYFYLFKDNFPTWSLPFVVLDVVFFDYLLNRMMKMFVWIFCLATYSCPFYQGHLKEANGRLRQTLPMLRLGLHVGSHPISSSLLGRVKRNLNHFMVVNTRMITYLTFTDKEVWASATGASFACQIPGNIYVVYRAMDHTLDGSRRVHNWIIMCNQIGMIFVALLLLAGNSKVIHAGHRHIPPVVGALGPRLLHYKLKFMTIYERLNSEQIIGISIGPFEAVTYRFIFELFLIYIAYILFFFNLFVEEI